MKKFNAKIKEVGNDHILTPYYMGDVDKAFLELYWGLKDDDVESYSIEEERSFSQTFYKRFYKMICDVVDEEDVKESGEYFISFEIDDLYVELCAHFHIRWQDDSFDHAFGTEYIEPYPVVENLEDIYDVEITDGDIKVSGFDYDMFWRQFEVFDFSGIKQGDHITYTKYGRQWEGSIVCYNTAKCLWKIDAGDKMIYTEKVKKVV